MTNSSAQFEPNSPDKFCGLDHLRTLAICLVFLFHYPIIVDDPPDWLLFFTKFGWTGVDLFFVLSGFLIASQLFYQIRNGQNISLKSFFLKRFFRILPAFWVVVVLYFCCPFFREKESLPSIWRFLTFTQNFGLNLKDFGTFSHAWSLCIEEHFYFFLPLILVLLQLTKLIKQSFWLLFILFLLGFFIRMYSWNNFYLPHLEEEDAWIVWYKYVYYPTYNRLDGLLVGVSIAGIYQFLPNFWVKIAKLGNQFILLSLVILTAAYFLCEDTRTFYASVFGFPLVASGYGFMVVGAISPTSFLYKWQSHITTFIATLSYAIYLIHKGLIHCVEQIFNQFEIEMNNNLVLLFCIICSILGALLIHLAIEKPFMALRNKIIKLE